VSEPRFSATRVNDSDFNFDEDFDEVSVSHQGAELVVRVSPDHRVWFGMLDEHGTDEPIVIILSHKQALEFTNLLKRAWDNAPHG